MEQFKITFLSFALVGLFAESALATEIQWATGCTSFKGSNRDWNFRGLRSTKYQKALENLAVYFSTISSSLSTTNLFRLL